MVELSVSMHDIECLQGVIDVLVAKGIDRRTIISVRFDGQGNFWPHIGVSDIDTARMDDIMKNQGWHVTEMEPRRSGGKRWAKWTIHFTECDL